MARSKGGTVRYSAERLSRLIRNLVRLSGGAPDRFSAAVTGDGQICIRCESTVAFYPLEAWISRFMRHLQRGYFEPCSGQHSPGRLITGSTSAPQADTAR